MAYPINGRDKEFVAYHSERHEQIQGDKGVENDGAMLPLLLRKQPRGEVIDGRRRAVPNKNLWNFTCIHKISSMSLCI